METNLKYQISKKKIPDKPTGHSDNQVEEFSSHSLYLPSSLSRELKAWPLDEPMPCQGMSLEKSMEEGIKDEVEGIMMSVESAKTFPKSELGAPGSSTLSKPSATARPNDNNNFPSTQISSNVDKSYDLSLSTSPSKITSKISIPSLVCATISPLSAHSPIASATKSSPKKQNMENKNPINLKRKRKNIGASGPKQKKAKTAAEIKKIPACKSCYHKHIGCERLTENESCRACERRKQPCERNDVRVVKGERTFMKDELTFEEHSTVSPPASRESTNGRSSEDNFTPVTTTDGGDEEECEKEVQRVLQTGEHGEKPEITRYREKKVDEPPKDDQQRDEESAPAKMTNEERDATDILMGLKSAKVELLDATTCNGYFETIKKILMGKTVDPNEGESGLMMLEKLRWQFIWITGYEGRPVIPNTLHDSA